jgi:hypothetical protein
LPTRLTAATHGGRVGFNIELALRWVYQDELPKRQYGGRFNSRSHLPSVSPMFRTAALGEGRERRGDPAFPAAAGDPHADAVAIEAAVNRLSRFRGMIFDDRDEIDPAGLMQGIEHMSVDLGGAIDWRQEVAEATGAMVGIVIAHARAGSRPHYRTTLPAPRADIGPNGKPQVLIDERFVEVYDERGRLRRAQNILPGAITSIAAFPTRAVRKGIYRQGAYCPLIYEPAPAALVAERAECAVWRAALETLAAELEGQLSAIAVLAPAAPWRPWGGEGELHGTPPQLRDEPCGRDTREQAAAKRRALQRRWCLSPQLSPRFRPTDGSGHVNTRNRDFYR